MCIIEYVGYSCGHSSVPVLRLCPITTHAPSNPVCKDPSHRPTMVGDMCPACSRVMHSRWVAIVMFEHQWMHERGTCGCPTKFPSLLHPRVIGADTGKEANLYTGQATLRGMSKQIGEDINNKFKLSQEDNGTSATDTTPTKSSSLTETPKIDHGTYSTACRDNTKPTTAAAAGVGHPSTGGSPRTNKGKSKKKKTHKPVKQKNKGRGKVGNQRQQHKNNHCEFDRHTMIATPHDTATDVLPPFATLNSDDEIVESFHLPPKEFSSSTDETQNQGQHVNIRLASQFAAEWAPDHAERHRIGACNCRVRFEQYQPYEVTEEDYYSGVGDSQGSTTSYLDHVTAGMEVLGFGEQPGSNNNNNGGGSSGYYGGGSISISPTTAAVSEAKGKGHDAGVFLSFASPSPEMAMRSNNTTDYGGVGQGTDYAALCAAAAHENTTGYATTDQFDPNTNHLVGMPTGNSSYTTAQNDYNTFPYNYPNDPAPPPSPISSATPCALLYGYQPEQTLRPSDIAHWRVLDSSPDPARAWAPSASASRSRPEDFGFRNADEAARALASTPEHVPIRSRPAAPVTAAEHLPNTLYYQHFDPDDPSTYPIVAWPLGAGPEGGPEYCHSPRWDVCRLARPRLRRSRSLDGAS